MQYNAYAFRGHAIFSARRDMHLTVIPSAVRKGVPSPRLTQCPFFPAQRKELEVACKDVGLSFRLDGYTTHHHDPLLNGGIFAVIAAAGNHKIFHDPHSIRIGLVSLEIRKAPTLFRIGSECLAL
jgi:hypothetical protein